MEPKGEVPNQLDKEPVAPDTFGATTGWVCPRCNRVHSPTVTTCNNCVAESDSQGRQLLTENGDCENDRL